MPDPQQANELSLVEFLSKNFLKCRYYILPLILLYKRKPIRSRHYPLTDTTWDCVTNIMDEAYDHPNDTFEQAVRRHLAHGFRGRKNAAKFKKIALAMFNRERRDKVPYGPKKVTTIAKSMRSAE
jgi:hypothetical protein